MNAQEPHLSYLSRIEAVTFRLKPGEDVKVSLENYVKKSQVKAACIITCVGSLEKVVIRYADQPFAEAFTGKFEIISLTGTIAELGSHLHVAISDEAGKMIGGHLKEGSLVYTTAEIVIGILPDVEFERHVDNRYGYRELVVKPLIKE